MRVLLDTVFKAILTTTLLEWIAVFSSVLYVFFAAKKLIICWFFALISSGIYVFLCYSGQLFIESALQVFYFLMAIYGWLKWLKSNENSQELKRWDFKVHFFNLIISSLVALILAFVFSKYTAQVNPYLDSFITIFSLSATFMVAKKVLENWVYWIIIDFASIFLYADRGFYLTAFLYLIYTIFAVYAYYYWLKLYKKQIHV